MKIHDMCVENVTEAVSLERLNCTFDDADLCGYVDMSDSVAKWMRTKQAGETNPGKNKSILLIIGQLITLLFPVGLLPLYQVVTIFQCYHFFKSLLLPVLPLYQVI